jgi:hypothetical protein
VKTEVDFFAIQASYTGLPNARETVVVIDWRRRRD